MEHDNFLYISFRAVIGPEGTRSIDSWSPWKIQIREKYDYMAT